MVTKTKYTGIRWLLDRSDSQAGISLRTAISMIPTIGTGTSVWLEAQLGAQQQRRIDALAKRLHELEKEKASYGKQDHENPYSDQILEAAFQIVASDADDIKGEIVAQILNFTDDDPTEIIRTFMLEACRQLTRYELVVLFELYKDAVGDLDATHSPVFLHLGRDPQNVLIYEYALDRLKTFRLIDGVHEDISVTEIGKKMAAFLKD
jgi:predicted Zn-dependent protease with MMP-like domain